jgi:hypothetical protein
LVQRVDIQHFNVSSCNNWPPQYYALTYKLIFGPKVDIQHFNVSLPTTGLLNTMHLHCNWSLVQEWIFNILMCPLANNWPSHYAPHYYAIWSLVQSGYSTF